MRTHMYSVWGLLGLLALAVVTLHLLVYTSFPSDPLMSTWPTSCPARDYLQILRERASTDKVIILALVDTAFADMALNLYFTSFKPHGIENFLFVGASGSACNILLNHSLPCFTYTEDSAEGKASVYMSKDFIRKMNIRTEMILDALNMGFTVLHTDLDVVFLKNPLPILADTEGDLVSLWDESVHNAGFILIRPTWYGKKVYQDTKQITDTHPKTDDQRALNQAIHKLKKDYPGVFKPVALSKNQFQCGSLYFEKGNRLFPRNCSECIVVHNNWIVSKEAKVYRFKEHFMWALDTDQYYSSTTRHYITYNNEANHGKEAANTAFETEALRSALAMGELLNRIVVLPKFHCGKTGEKICPLNSHFKMNSFDAQFGNQYRENSFLKNQMVSQSIVESQSPMYFIATREASEALKMCNVTLNSEVIQLHPNKAYNVTPEEILTWFSNRTEHVLRFHSLGGIHIEFSDKERGAFFQKHVDKGFKKGSYRQL